jgi:hypothetical protein
MASARIAFVLSFDRKLVDGIPVAEVKVDAGDGDPTTHDHWQPAGDDAQPCVGDAVLLVDSPGSGEEEIVAYADVKNAGVVAAGERRLYGRNAGGTIVVSLHLKADGAAVLANAAGSITLGADGNVTITGDLKVNGEVTADGEVTAKALVPAAKVGVSTHIHVADGANTTAPTPGI